jgi:hypothetical protein
MDETKETKTPNEAQGIAPEPPSPPYRRARRDALFLPTFAGGLVGMLAGTLPAAIWFLVFRTSFAPMYIFLPLLIYLGFRIFRGYNGRRGLLMLCIFTMVGFYLTLLSVSAAAYVTYYHMSSLSFPLVTVTLLGQRGVLTGSFFSSAYIFPLVFMLLGVFLAEELLMRKAAPAQAPEMDDETVPNGE